MRHPVFFRVGDVRGRGCRLRVGVVGGGEEVTQRLGREADGNYVCLAWCTGRKRWLIPFGETFVFTIFYSFVYF